MTEEWENEGGAVDYSHRRHAHHDDVSCIEAGEIGHPKRWNEKTRLLIIDDIRNLPLESSVTVRTAEEGIEKINSSEWDEIWLDYDLGGKLTIMPLIYVLEDKQWKVIPTIYVHTQNPVGRERIRRILGERYKIIDVLLASA